MDDIVKTLLDTGFKPTLNSDEDFPALEGEYGVSVKTLRPWDNKDTQQKEAYMLQLSISNTLSGETADGRLLTRFYRIAGNGYDGTAITSEQAGDNLKRLCNDLFTLGVELDRSSSEALEASFANAIGAVGFARAWKSKNRNDPEGALVQNFRIKVGKDLRKASTATARALF